MEQVDRSPKAPERVADTESAAARPSSFNDWMPAILWMAALFVLSTTYFSAANTSKLIEPVLRWIFPSASMATIGLLHALIRKAAHFTNYAILFWLLIRGPLKERPYTALACCVIYAFLDEGHQIFAVGRGASLYDVALDSSGALFSRFLNAAVYDGARADPA
jgi:VanZ family protein